MQILLAANGKHLFPKQVFDAQTPPMNMSYAAIRKLMREMMRGGLRRDQAGYYLLKGSNLTQKEINAAPRNEVYKEIKMHVERIRRQRHTVASDCIWALDRVSEELRAELNQIRNPKTHSEIESDSEN
jgi:hypothetical protein